MGNDYYDEIGHSHVSLKLEFVVGLLWIKGWAAVLLKKEHVDALSKKYKFCFQPPQSTTPLSLQVAKQKL